VVSVTDPYGRILGLLDRSRYFSINPRNHSFSKKVLMVGKPEGKRLLGRPRHRWVANSKMDHGEVGLADVDWIGLAQDRGKWRALVNVVMNLWVP
jgi:hypothetical protein